MKSLLAILCALVLLGMNTTGYAETKKAVKKKGRALEGTVQTRIGELKFEKGYPSNATIKKLYNEMDFQRAVQAYLWALPLVEMAEWQKAQKDIFKAGTNDFVTYLTFTEKLGILTANATTPYMMAFPNLKETGPMVFEIPPGPTAGGLLDFWERPFSDLGQTGPDKGKGAKYLILGPGHPEMNPEGYIIVRSPHWNVFLGHRVLHPDPAKSAQIMKAHKLYPYSERKNPKPTHFISSEGIDWEAFQPRGVEYFERLASILEIEPVEPRDYMIMAMLRPLGIMPGVKFSPTSEQIAIFEEAAIVGEAMARANSYEKRFEGARVWSGKYWEKSLFLTDTDQDLDTHTQLDERASWFYEAIGVTDGMMGKIVGAGQEYLEAQKDSDGDWLDGGKNYVLRIPANAPVKQFWSVTVYDNDDRCLIDTGELPDKSSRMDLQWNKDGSVDLYFGPKLPKGAPKKNWVKTVPGEGWFTYFRFYAPTQPYFDQTWQLPDIKKVPSVGISQQSEELTDVEYYGYKIVHHMAAVVDHIEKFGFNTFDHPRIADYRSFVITPALDHLYSKAVADVRFGPVIIDTPAKDDRYSSLEIFDVEHHAIYDKVTDKEGERFVIVHEDYKGKLPKGTVIKTASNFPFVFIRTQSFAFNNDKLANSIRHEARMYGLWEPVDLPNPKDTQSLIKWTIANSKPYPQTEKVMARAAEIYTPAVHKKTFEHLKAFLASGGVSGNVGMFEPVDHPAGGSHKIRAAGTLLGHLGFPVHHAYYQQIPVDKTGKKLAGSNGPFVLTLPYKPGVDLFWSVTRYDANTFLPLNPADIGNNDIQAYNGFNTKPDKNGNVTFTFSKEDPKDGTYWMPVLDSGYYILARYYGPTPRLNGNTAKDILYKGTKLEKKFKTVKFK